jgi:hypothetical protein
MTDKATSVIEVIVKLIVLFGFESTSFKKKMGGKFAPYLGSTAHKADIEHWTNLMQSVHWVKVTKYKIAAYYQVQNLHLLKDKTLPEKPFPQADSVSCLLRGTAGRFMERIVGRHKTTRGRVEREEFLSSILQLKKGMPRPEKDFLELALKSTVKTLSGVKPRVDSSVPRAGIHAENGILRFNLISQQIRRMVIDIVGNESFHTSRDLLSRPYMPSLSAAYALTRAKLGTFGWQRENGLLGSEEGDRPILEFVSNDISREPVFVTEDEFGNELPRNRQFSVRGQKDEEMSSKVSAEVPTFTVRGLNGMRDQFTKTYFDTARMAMEEQPFAEPVALAEALKARVITKGPPATMFCLKPLQRFMARLLRKHSVFELVGKAQNVETVSRVMGALPEGEFWLSGDYSDATNQLDPKLSGIVWDTMCDVCKVPVSLRQLGHRALTGHVIKFEGEHHLQQWGQLMGSIISFPVLCIVNATICRMAMEYSRGELLSLKDLQLLVNGDDCVFPVSQEGYAFWQTAGKMAGLSPSVGKVYFSDQFLNINSTNYQYWHFSGGEVLSDELMPWQYFTETKAVNLGLLLGIKRSETDVKEAAADAVVDDGWSSLGTRHWTLMDKSPDRTLLRVHQAFLRENEDKLAKARPLPYYIPKCYGGVGLKPMPEFQRDGINAVPSLMDRQIVTAMIKESLWARSNGHDQLPKPQQVKAGSNTQIHRVAQAVLKLGLPPLETEWVTEDSDVVDGLDVPELDLFVVYCFPEEVEGSEEEVNDKIMSHNKRVWSWFGQHMGEFVWMTPFEEIKARKLVHKVQLLTENGHTFAGSDWDLAEHWGDYQEMDLWSTP